MIERERTKTNDALTWFARHNCLISLSIVCFHCLFSLSIFIHIFSFGLRIYQICFSQEDHPTPVVTLEPDAFWGLDQVNDLYLDGILATRLTPFSFRGLSNVAHLYLRQTRVAVIEPHAFSGLVNVAYLHLDESKIRNIQVNTARCIERKKTRLLLFRWYQGACCLILLSVENAKKLLVSGCLLFGLAVRCQFLPPRPRAPFYIAGDGVCQHDERVLR